MSHQAHNKSDSRVADVDPRINLMEVLRRPAVEAALVRQQVVELSERHLEARHVGWLTCLDPLVVFNPHAQRPDRRDGRRSGRGARRERRRAAAERAGGRGAWGGTEPQN